MRAREAWWLALGALAALLAWRARVAFSVPGAALSAAPAPPPPRAAVVTLLSSDPSSGEYDASRVVSLLASLEAALPWLARGAGCRRSRARGARRG